MHKTLWILLILLLAPSPGAAESFTRVSPIRPVATYSIVARDAETGELGAAVQSHWFSVGSLVIWGRAGAGVVATQSMVDPSYGPLGLEMMAAGRSAPAALRGLVEADAHADIRQVAMVDASGEVAAHTGGRCIAEAGHIVGDGYSVQANMMGPDTVPRAMADAYEAARGPLAERLLAALTAAQDAGGDIRGRQSAAILVVGPEYTGRPWQDIRVQLRIEDHPQPIVEMTRLLKMHRGYEQMNAGDLAIEKGEIAAAAAAYAAAETILGENPEARYWHAIALANAGDLDRALPIFAEIFANGDNWRILTPRLLESGFLDVGEADLKRIMAAGR